MALKIRFVHRNIFIATAVALDAQHASTSKWITMREQFAIYSMPSRQCPRRESLPGRRHVHGFWGRGGGAKVCGALGFSIYARIWRAISTLPPWLVLRR